MIYYDGDNDNSNVDIGYTDNDDRSRIISLEEERQRRVAALTKVGARLQKMIKEAREHPLGLYRLCFMDDRGEPIILKWFHKEWADMILQNSHVMIEAPRGSTKTSFIVATILWVLGHNPELRIKLVCGNDSHAAKRLREIRSHITQNQIYQRVFPGVEEDPDETNNIQIMNLKRRRHGKDATLEAKGILSDGTGDRSDLIVLDDVCTRKNSVDEPSTRPKVLSKLRSDWLNTLNPRDGRVWSIFTPWHSEDANAILKKETKGRWAYKHYAHGKPGDPYHSIFPELFTSSWLRMKRLDIGSIEYSKAYLCTVKSDDVQIVQSRWLKTYNKLDITSALLQRATVVLSVDPTGGKRSNRSRSSDPDYYGFAILLIDTTPNGNQFRPKTPNRIYIVDAYQTRLSTAHAAQYIIQLAQKWQADITVIETQGAQSVHEWVYEIDSSIPVQEWPANLSKKARLESITPWLQDHRERILFHPRTIEPDPKPFYVTVYNPKTEETHRAEARRTLRNQLLDFPTTHDDVMDALVQGLRFTRQCILPLDNEGQEDPHDIQEDRSPNLDLDIRTISY